MHCSNCGTQLNDGATSCPSCGKPVQQAAQPTVQNIYVTQQANPSNGAATAGLIFGILAFVTEVTIIFNLLGVIFSIVGLVKAKKLGGVGKTKSIIGLILSTITLVVGLILIVVIFVLLLGMGAAAATSAAPLFML